MTSVVSAVATGGLRLRPDGGFDFVLPLYMLLALVLLVSAAGFRLSPWTGGAAFALGTLWAWVAAEAGVVPAAAGVVLGAIVVGGLRRRWPRTD